MKTALALLALVVGCGSADPGDALTGLWVLSAGSCGKAFTFDGTRYEFDVACDAGPGAVNLQAELGTYSANGKQLTLSPQKATCATAPGGTVNYSLGADGLTLSSNTGIAVFARRAASSGGTGVQATLGCFEQSGFVAGPLHSL